jgi:hypothetical protein
MTRDTEYLLRVVDERYDASMSGRIASSATATRYVCNGRVLPTPGLARDTIDVAGVLAEADSVVRHN